MTTPDHDLPPYEPARMIAAPFPERVRLICRTWAAQVFPNPPIVLITYWLKYLLVFIGGWAFFVSFSAGYPGFPHPGEWAFMPIAFQKAIVWALFYEIAGFGCSWGPMNGRFKPPMGGFLYFLRPGTTKLALFPDMPIFGGIRRTWLDVALYAATLLFLLRALVAPEITDWMLLPACILIAVLGVTDKTLFLAARSEHYWVALVCLIAASQDLLWVSACKVVWVAIWFWAATSKLNHHFPSVIMYMVNNGPFAPRALKERLFVSYPDDLRPSRLAGVMAHAGTFVEYMIPVVLLSTDGGWTTTAGLVGMTCFHGFIALNNPSGMPIEWNIVMIWGAWFLFGVHHDASITAIASMPFLVTFLAFWLVLVPAYGNVVPSRVSFLLAMRYYAGNWAYNIWLIRRDALPKLDRLTKMAGTMREQLASLLPDPQQVDVACSMSLAHRFLHLEGRPLLDALPKAVDDIEAYEWIDGEVFGGMVVGWNFGDGHLNDTQLLEAVQAQCGFEDGEVRVIMVESQPIFGRTMQWKIADAKRGVIAEGETAIAPMRAAMPWPTGAAAEALASRHASAVS
jgi:hypothetical protein